jgi:gamma-glutamylcysteine synthetase
MFANLAKVVNDMKEENKKSHDQRIEERQEYILLTKERLVFEQMREEREKETNLLSKKRLEMEQSREVREQEANLLRKKRLEMEQSREDREIMSMDTGNMSPMKKIIFSFKSNGNH